MSKPPECAATLFKICWLQKKNVYQNGTPYISMGASILEPPTPRRKDIE